MNARFAPEFMVGMSGIMRLRIVQKTMLLYNSLFVLKLNHGGAMSQKQVKRLRRKARDIVNNEFSLINDDVAKELNNDADAIAEWFPLALTARITLPEKNIKEFLPSNFVNIYRALLLDMGYKPYSGELIEGNEFLSKVFEFAQEFSSKSPSLNLNNRGLLSLFPLQI